MCPLSGPTEIPAMQSRLSRTYYVPAIRSRAIPRPHLLALLGAGSSRSALTLVSGQAGGGKSTVLAQWAGTLDVGEGSLIWIGLQADDSGHHKFWHTVGLALGSAVITDEPTLASLTPTSGGGINLYPFIHAVLSNHTPELTIVLDDYHLVSSELIDQQIARLLLDAPAVRIVIGSRATTSLHASELAARLDTTIIDSDALSFTADESEMLVTASDWGDDAQLAAAIHQSTLGWPLASQALLAEVRRDPLTARNIVDSPASRPGFIRDFVARTLKTRSAVDRDFVLRIALADECTVALASILSAHSAATAETLLGQLELEGIGIWQTRAGVTWFRMHPLLRDAFELASDATLPPETSAQLRSHLARHLAETRPLRALELASRARDWSLMSDLVVLHWLDYSYYHRESSTALLRQVPRSVWRTHPALLGGKIVQDYGDYSIPIEVLAAEFADYSAATRQYKPQPGLVGALLELLHMGVHRIFGDMSTVLLKTGAVLATLAECSSDELRIHRASVPIVYVQLGITWLINGEYSRALDSFARANALAVDLSSLGEQFQVLALKAFTHSVRGDVVEAQQWIARCEAADPYDGWRGDYLQAGYHLARAAAAVNRGEPERAREVLHELRASEPVIEYWPYVAVIRAQIDTMLDGPSKAYSTMQEYLARKRWRPAVPEPLNAMLLATRASLLVMAGQTARAESELSAATGVDTPELTLARAQLAWAQASHTAAISLAESVAWVSDDSPLLRTRARLIIAVAAIDAGDDDRAADAFAAAVTELVERGLRTPMMLVPADHRTRLIAACATRGITIAADIALDGPSTAHAPRAVRTLSRGERRVLAAVSEAGTASAAADLLHLSEHTVRYHLKGIYKKLGATGRAEAISIAQEHGMLDLGAAKPGG